MSNKQRKRANVLVVDDQYTNLALVAKLLKEAYDIRIANGGRKGIQLAEERRPDLVLLDVEMPELNGYETCERLLALPDWDAVPILFLTANSSARAEERGFQAGAVDYIRKPFSAPVLRARVRTHLDLRAAVKAAEHEQRRANALLDVLMPNKIADELRETGTVVPRLLDGGCVLFADIVGFTAWCADRPPEEVVDQLHALFSAVEPLLDEHGLDKLKTIGDCLMAATEVDSRSSTPLTDAVRCGLAMQRHPVLDELGVQLRIGLHQGPMVAGIVGKKRYQYDVWGDTVNIAARLTSAARPGCVCIDEKDWYAICEDVEAQVPGLRVDFEGHMLKGKGTRGVAQLCR